jgi:hypothetical protein
VIPRDAGDDGDLAEQVDFRICFGYRGRGVDGGRFLGVGWRRFGCRGLFVLGRVSRPGCRELFSDGVLREGWLWRGLSRGDLLRGEGGLGWRRWGFGFG